MQNDTTVYSPKCQTREASHRFDTVDLQQTTSLESATLTPQY